MEGGATQAPAVATCALVLMQGVVRAVLIGLVAFCSHTACRFQRRFGLSEPVWLAGGRVCWLTVKPIGEHPWNCCWCVHRACDHRVIIAKRGYGHPACEVPVASELVECCEDLWVLWVLQTCWAVQVHECLLHSQSFVDPVWHVMFWLSLS